MDLLSRYLDGELAGSARAEVESHLRGCAGCARHLEELAAVDAAARELPVPAPPGYFESLPARVRARLPAPRRKSPPVWVWAAAAGLAVAALVPLLSHQARSPLPEPALIREQAPPAPATASTPVAPAREEAPAAAPADVPAESRARDKVAAKDLLEALRAENAAAATPAQAQAQVPKHGGPWAQAPSGAAAPPARAASDEAQKPQAARAATHPDEGRQQTAQMEQARAAREIPRQPGAEVKAESEPERRSGLTDAVVTFAQAPPEETRYRALLARRTASAAEDRQLHDEWRALVASYPTGAHADEARVRALEALLSAYRREGEARDRERLREEASQYLQRSDAAQPGRVRALLEAAGVQP